MKRRDLIVIWVTVACGLVLPWPVAILTHNANAAVAAVLVPVLVGGAILRRRGW